ncbi:MAG: TATA box-binding protein [Nitrososphaerota archaeon]
MLNKFKSSKLFRFRGCIVNIYIENVVSSVTFPHPLDLDVITKVIPAKRHKQRFTGTVCRISRPPATILLFASGKCVCTGVKSEEEAKAAVSKLVSELREKGVRVGDPEVSVQNVVVSASIGFTINVEKVAEKYFGHYEPEKFPGAIIHDNGKTFLIFANGKVVCVGSKTIDEAVLAINDLAKKLVDFLL